MASIARRPGGRWRARYRDEANREHARHFTRKVDAQRWLDEVTTATITGAYVHPRAGRITVQAFSEQWLARQQLRPSTRASYEQALRRVQPTLGALPLSAVRRSHIEQTIVALSETLAPSTTRQTLAVTGSVFAAAVADRRIPANPVPGVRLPEVHRPRVEPLTVAQVRALEQAMPPRWQAAVTLGAGMGVRQGEMLAVTADRIDLDGRRLVVDRQLVDLPGEGPQFAPPKTRASVRTIPVPEVVAAALTEHLRSYPPGRDGLVFHRGDGRPLLRVRWSEIWAPAARAAGLPAGTGYHALRHFYASLLIRHGESVKVVQARLGHSSAAQTWDVYSHMWPDADDRTRAAVDDVLGSAD